MFTLIIVIIPMMRRVFVPTTFQANTNASEVRDIFAALLKQSCITRSLHGGPAASLIQIKGALVNVI